MEVQKPQFRTDTIYFKIAFSILPVIIAKRPYPIPSRTRKSSSFASMVLHGRLCGRVDRHRLFLFLCLVGAPTASAALLMWWEHTLVRPHAHSSMLPCICIQPSTKKYFCFVLISRNMRHFARLPKIARRATRRVAPPHRQGETTRPNPHQMSLNPEDKHRDHL